MTPRYVTVSEMQDFLKCRWRWYAKWRLNRVPRRYSDALILGTAVHDILEAHFKGQPLTYAFDQASLRLHEGQLAADDPDERLAVLRAFKDLQKFRPQIVGWADRFKIEETLAVEESFEVLLPNGWLFRGRPDRPVLVGGTVYHMQHKTVGGSKAYDVYAQFLARSLHETGYGFVLRDEYAHVAPYGGSIINMIRKRPSPTTAAALGNNFQAIVPLSAFDLERGWSNICAIAREMERAEKRGLWEQIDNAQEDAGPFMNSLDGYLPVLQGKARLDDDTLFMSREETYR